MNQYKCIITAVDLNPESDAITVERAKKLAKDADAKLYLVHAVESITSYGAAYAFPDINNIEGEISEKHKQQLIEEAKKLDIPEENLILGSGPAGTVIVKQATELNADLIVVGSHSRHGLELLLGSTANSVLHNAPCDVLAIHLPK